MLLKNIHKHEVLLLASYMTLTYKGLFSRGMFAQITSSSTPSGNIMATKRKQGLKNKAFRAHTLIKFDHIFPILCLNN